LTVKLLPFSLADFILIWQYLVPFYYKAKLF